MFWKHRSFQKCNTSQTTHSSLVAKRGMRSACPICSSSSCRSSQQQLRSMDWGWCTWQLLSCMEGGGRKKVDVGAVDSLKEKGENKHKQKRREVERRRERKRRWKRKEEEGRIGKNKKDRRRKYKGRKEEESRQGRKEQFGCKGNWEENWWGNLHTVDSEMETPKKGSQQMLLINLGTIIFRS